MCDVSTSAEVCHDALVDLVREETFEAPDDLTFGAAVGRTSHNVVDRWLVVPHADDDRPIEGGVGLAVTAPVEAVPPSGPPGRGGDGTRATELREGGLRANPLGVVAEDNQELGRAVGAHPEPRPEGGRRPGRESREVPVVCGDFLGEGEPASGQRPQSVLYGGGGRVKATWPEGCTARQQARSGEAVEGFSHHRRRVDADLLQRVHRRGARLHGGIPRDFELPDHLDGTIRGLWRRGRLARQHRSGGGLGVDPVGLAGDAAQAPVRSIHFHNTMPRSADRTRKAHAIAAGVSSS